MRNLEARAVPGGGVEAIRLIESAVPVPGPGEALVRINAATLNYRDHLAATGLLPGIGREPDYVPLSCGAGIVVAVGEGVERVRPGDRVMPSFDQLWLTGGQDQRSTAHLGGNRDGVARRFACFSAEALVLIPDMLGDLEAATLPCAGVTAWSSLFVARTTGPGDWVLLQGTGGVSIAALQLAKAAGARVVVTSSSDAKLARAASHGADVLINYRRETDWAAAARAATGGAGADVVLDVAGGAESERAASALRQGGMLCSIGMLDGAFAWGRDLGDVVNVPITTGSRDDLAALAGFIARHAVHPVVDLVYPLERIGDSFRRLERADFFGKIAVAMPE